MTLVSHFNRHYAYVCASKALALCSDDIKGNEPRPLGARRRLIGRNGELWFGFLAPDRGFLVVLGFSPPLGNGR